MSEFFPNDAENRSARVPTTCFIWLIGSMNECYIEINQDFTKVKTTQTLSWYLDLCMIAIFCNVLMDASINTLPPFSFSRILDNKRLRECMHCILNSRLLVIFNFQNKWQILVHYFRKKIQVMISRPIREFFFKFWNMKRTSKMRKTINTWKRFPKLHVSFILL